jgi:hypothetical protein
MSKKSKKRAKIGFQMGSTLFKFQIGLTLFLLSFGGGALAQDVVPLPRARPLSTLETTPKPVDIQRPDPQPVGVDK